MTVELNEFVKLMGIGNVDGIHVSNIKNYNYLIIYTILHLIQFILSILQLAILLHENEPTPGFSSLCPIGGALFHQPMSSSAEGGNLALLLNLIFLLPFHILCVGIFGLFHAGSPLSLVAIIH